MPLFPRHYQGAGEEVEHLEHESVPTRDVTVTGSGFIGTTCSVSIHFGMNPWLEKFFLSLFLVLSHSSFQIINLYLKNVEGKGKAFGRAVKKPLGPSWSLLTVFRFKYMWSDVGMITAAHFFLSISM